VLAAVVLGAAPENLGLGVSLIEEASVTAGCGLRGQRTRGARRSGGNARRGPRAAIRDQLWRVTAHVLAPAVVIGRAALGGVADETLSFVLAFAGGAVRRPGPRREAEASSVTHAA
jgi:hypothetical protein